MRALVFVAAWVLLAAPARGQAEVHAAPTRAAQIAVFAELGGPGLIYSLNYDRGFTDHLSARIGLAYWTVDLIVIEARARLVPLTLNYLTGRGGARGEFGVGLVVGSLGARAGRLLEAFGEEESTDFDMVTAAGLVGTIGFRYQPRDGGVLFRLGFTPLYFGYKVIPWVALSLGYAF